jgi:hypothetical protein
MQTNHKYLRYKFRLHGSSISRNELNSVKSQKGTVGLKFKVSSIFQIAQCPFPMMIIIHEKAGQGLSVPTLEA